MYQHLLPNQYNNNTNNYYLNERTMSVPHLISKCRPMIYNNYNNIQHDISKYNYISQTPNNYNQIPIQFISPIHSPLYNQYQYHSPLLCHPRFIREGPLHKASSHLCKNKGCNGVKQGMNDGNSKVKKIKLKQINSCDGGDAVIDRAQIEVVKDIDDDKYVLINKNTLKEIIDNKLKSFEQKQQNDCNYIAELISKENEAIPHIIKAMPKLIEMKIKENEQRKQIEKLKEEKLLFKIKQDFHKERKTILQQYTNNSFQTHQITQLPSLYIEAKHKPIVDVSEIVKEKLIEHAIRKTIMKDKECIREYIAKDMLGKGKRISKSERHKLLMKELQVKELEIDSRGDVNEISSEMEKKVKFQDNKKLPIKMIKDNSDNIEEDSKNSRNKKKSKKEKIINDNNNIKQQSTLTNKENENDDDNNNEEQVKEKKRKKKKKK